MCPRREVDDNNVAEASADRLVKGDANTNTGGAGITLTVGRRSSAHTGRELDALGGIDGPARRQRPTVR